VPKLRKHHFALIVPICSLSVNALAADLVTSQPPVAVSATLPIAASPRATYAVPNIEISGFAGRNGERASINSILPLLRNDQRLLFLGVDGALLGSSTDRRPYNFGAYLGYRERVNNHVIGGWIGADTTRTASGNNYQRLIAGVESYGPRFIFRANGFLPLRNGGNLPTITSISPPTQTIDETIETVGSPGLLNEAQIITTQTTITNTTTRLFYREYLPKGFNAEIGLRHHFENNNQLSKIREFRAFVGTYTLFGLRKNSDQITGLRTRFEIDAYPFEQKPEIRVSLEGQYSYDQYQRGQVRVSLRLSIPLGDDPVSNRQKPVYTETFSQQTSSASSQDLYQPVRRNDFTPSFRRPAGSATTSVSTVNTVVNTYALQY
jgi:Inverse autotransporter, beta-domain